MLILGYPDYEAQGRALANALGAAYSRTDIHRFPDGESRVRLPASVPEHTVLCRSLDQPNEKLIELLLSAETARSLGARRLSLVAPYLCYMRQDTAFETGDAVSQRIIGRLLGELFDDIVTVDPHLHRTSTLADALPNTRALALTATGLMAEQVRRHAGSPVLIGPDEESRQWVQRVAEQTGRPYAVATKSRYGDRHVQIDLPDFDLNERETVLIDDVASSGETLATAARAVRAAGGSTVTAMVTHGLFAPGAVDALRAAGVREVISSDSVSHPSNGMVLAAVLAEGLSRIA